MSNKKNWLSWLIIIVILVLVSWGIAKLTESNTKNNQEILTIQADDNIRGDKNAPLVLIVYSDFQCPACKIAAFYEQLLSADSALGDKVAVIYRHFPLNMHGNSYLAAQTSEAAARQNKFWEMYNVLFDKQSEWAEQANAGDIFNGYAESLGLNLEQFKNDLDSQTVKDKIEKNKKEGGEKALNLSGTPTLYLNGQLIQLPDSYDKFRQLLSAQLPS